MSDVLSVSSVKEHLSVDSPLVWVVSEEPRRVTNEVIDWAATYAHSRGVFRLDPFDGLVTWIRQAWRQVLVDTEDGPAPTKDLEAALAHVVKAKGIFILEHAHILADSPVFKGFLTALHIRYLDGFHVDSHPNMPAMFIMISYKDTPPPELARDTAIINLALPTPAQLGDITTHVTKAGDLKVSRDTAAKIIRAAQGLTEAEYVRAAMLSVHNRRGLDPNYINQIKIDTLKRSSTLEIRHPNYDISSVGGMDQLKEMIKTLTWSWDNPDKLTQLNKIEPMRRVLLVGLTGSGKSLFAEAAASALNLDLAKFGVSQAMSKWLGESEQNMRRSFKSIRALAPIVLWIDEFGRDAAGGVAYDGDGGASSRVHGEFLTGLQELPPDVCLICAANNIDHLPPEMTRADRFDKIVFVGFPSREERAEIFKIHLGQRAEDYDLKALAGATSYFTGAEIKAMIRECTFALRQAPTTAELVEYAPRVKGRAWILHREQIHDMYVKAKDSWDWASSSQEADADKVIKAARVTV